MTEHSAGSESLALVKRMQTVFTRSRYALCAHLELKDRSHDELKWDENSPLKKVGTFDELEPEARRIVRATLCA